MAINRFVKKYCSGTYAMWINLLITSYFLKNADFLTPANEDT